MSQSDRTPDPDESSAPVATDLQATTLEQLLQLASLDDAAQFGHGTRVGECIDTHHPHLGGRVLVRAYGDDGGLVCAWLAMLGHVSVRTGDRVLIQKPENWPEALIVGVIAGSRASRRARQLQAEQEPSGAPELQLMPGRALLISGPDGRALMRLAATDHGPHIELLQPDVSLEASGCLRFAAERIELAAGSGGVDIRSDGDAVVRARTIRLN